MKVNRSEIGVSAFKPTFSQGFRAAYLGFGVLMLLLSGCNNQTDDAPLEPGASARDATRDLHVEHAEHAPAVAPPAGERWPTDAPLRTAMTSIRTSVESILPLHSQGTLQAAEATALAEQVEKDVRYMIENCELEPEADAALHVLIGRMIHAADALRTDPAAEGGVPQLVSVLHDYEATFDHPGFEHPVSAGTDRGSQ